MNAIRIIYKSTRKATTQNKPLTQIGFSSRERDSGAIENSIEEQERWSEGTVLGHADTGGQLWASESDSQIEDVTTRQTVVDQEEGVSPWRHEIRDFERQL